MKRIIHAQVVATAISFPDEIEIQYQPVDARGNRVGNICYREGPYAWAKVISKFWIDIAYAKLCEGYFKEGSSALIQRPADIEGEWTELVVLDQ